MVSVDRGDISQMSFGFTVDKDEWHEDKEGRVTRTIHEVGRLLDVSVVSFPAYSDTSVALRSLEKLKEKEDKPLFTPVDVKEEVEERELTTDEIKVIVSEVIDKVAALKAKVVVEPDGKPTQTEGEKEGESSEPMQGDEIRDFFK
jgi:hypothetical protein